MAKIDSMEALSCSDSRARKVMNQAGFGVPMNRIRQILMIVGCAGVTHGLTIALLVWIAKSIRLDTQSVTTLILVHDAVTTNDATSV